MRKDGWTEEEVERLRQAYSVWPRDFSLLPGRTRKAIVTQANARGFGKDAPKRAPSGRCGRCGGPLDGATRAYCKACNRLVTDEWRAQHSKRAREINQESRSKHREQRNQEAAEWYLKNKTRSQANGRRWKHTEQGRLYARLERHARRGQPINMEHARILLADPCAYCGEPATAIDHITPITKGGTSEWENLAPACGSCNSSKGNRLLLTFLLVRRKVI